MESVAKAALVTPAIFTVVVYEDQLSIMGHNSCLLQWVTCSTVSATLLTLSVEVGITDLSSSGYGWLSSLFYQGCLPLSCYFFFISRTSVVSMPISIKFPEHFLMLDADTSSMSSKAGVS